MEYSSYRFSTACVDRNFIDNYGWVPVDVTPAADGTMRVSYPGYNMEIFNQIMQQNNWTADMPSINDISKEKQNM